MRLLLPCAPVALALLFVACSDDSGTKTDGPATGPDAAVTDQGTTAPDQGTTGPDQGTTGPDQGTTGPDQGTTPDQSTAKTLTSSHNGWQQKQCGNCHNLPVTGHTTSDVTECANCHGGNGACDPNGANSNKQNHTSGLTCTGGCHGSSKHGFSVASQCVSCHFAAAGTVDCP